MRASLGATLCLVVVSAAAFAYVHAKTPAPGLRATVFNNTTFTGIPLATVADQSLSIDALATAAGVPAEAPFSVDWSGWLHIEQPGSYRYRLAVDDGAVVWIGDRAIVDVTGPPGVYERRGTEVLEPGIYPVQIRYVQHLGDRQFSFQWSRPGHRATVVTPTFWQPGAGPPALMAVRLARWLALAVPLMWSAWILSALLLAFWKAGGFGHPWRGAPQREVILLGTVLAVSATLIAVGMTWGLFPTRAWHPEELTPLEILAAVGARFSNGWSHLYPPLHFIVTALVMAPTLIAERVQWLSLQDPTVLASLHLTGRFISLAMAVLTLVIAWMIGRETIGRSRAVVAVFLVGTAQLFTFYGKTANVDIPYVMWVTTALFFYLRAAKYQKLPDFIRLGIAVAFAIATKDQAVGFFAGPAIALVWASWRQSRGPALVRFGRTAFDPRLWAGAVTCVTAMILAYGVPWNYAGVQAHVEYATGWRMAGFRMFDNTVDGQLRLLGMSIGILPWSLGVVPAILAAMGAWVAVKRWWRFRWLWWLTVPIVSYYVSVIMTIGYVYDRFLLAWLVVIAQFGALGLDLLWRTPRLPARVRLALGSACVIGALVPAAYLDAEMAVFGSRGRMERWLAAHTNELALVVGTGNATYLPSLASYRHVIVNTHTEELVDWNADTLVVNEDWLKRDDLPRTRLVEILARASYDEMHREAAPQRPWWVLALGGVLPNDGLTNMLKVSPTYTVWQKRAPTP